MLDRWAIWLSGLCIAHCLVGAIFLALAATTGGVFLDPIVHEVGLGLAIVLGVMAIGRGIMRHGNKLPLLFGGAGIAFMGFALSLHDGLDHASLEHGGLEIAYTILGVTLLAIGHAINRRAYR
ncbi:MAG: MerC domain-containing protein [Pseudomonadota bacterium]